MFEYVYFSRPDSIIGGINVAKVRTEMGRELARRYPVAADIVVPVPDSGNYAALGFAQELKIPYEHAFVRNHYIGRTFLQPSQLIRDFDVRVKLNLIKEAVEGKRVVVVDDSIVRGTTARARVVNLREAGAKEVHMRVSCPPHRFACHYGIDFPDPEKLIANQLSMEKICEYLGVDSLGYLDVDGMVRATGKPANEFCLACFTGNYPLPVDPELDKFIMEKREGRSKALAAEEAQPTPVSPISSSAMSKRRPTPAPGSTWTWAISLSGGFRRGSRARMAPKFLGRSADLAVSSRRTFPGCASRCWSQAWMASARN